jgi:hypothetical protein
VAKNVAVFKERLKAAFLVASVKRKQIQRSSRDGKVPKMVLTSVLGTRENDAGHSTRGVWS